MTYENSKAVWTALSEIERQDRPREKMELKGAGSLSDLELIMLLVSSGTAERPVNEVSSELLALLDKSEELTDTRRA